ncbi:MULTISPECIES: ATP-binding protein [unclassified Methylobacterium]|jgi:signal transduction histidine kinase|uniref:ATP-binding response regulator n=1 Tax=unclassified Methylobacterium TaxID=2615210 RepID=UPI0006F2A07E|nr:MULTISPECIES: ATP-binding protein [unclassified Methylobacterium]KQO64061.1 ATPase [Methylobacterium sp. Leaf88]KQP76990.1 ATPase [Methylobacterium sp. Leaf111]KQU26135.1 ATPase [Methylobacterium sp. Leaf94]
MILPPEAASPAPEEDANLRRIAKLERINAALMAHVERSMDQQGGAYSLFQTATMLEGRVRTRTEELTGLMHRLERSNAALVAAKEEAENANRSKTRFLAAASHDLLQPLNAARLSASALADLGLGPEAAAISGQIERGLQIIEDLIKTLLDISKLDAGVVRPAIKPVALGELLAGIAASFRPFAERKGLRLTVRGPDLAVASDPMLLQRILQNLVSNAIRYTRQGGVLVAIRHRGDACRIEVLDTGCGIAPAEQGLVFEEFFRGGAEGEGGEPGLGLGLSIVRRMAQALDHPLDLASRVGRGTRMALTVPVSLTPPERAVPSAPVTTRLTGARVLVVENDPPTADALERLLRTWDAEVCVHRDLAGVAASLAAGKSLPDLLILDYHLDNGACGLDVAIHLQARAESRLPVIVTTANHSPEIEAQVAEFGAQLVHKPVRPAELRALLTYLLT